jgi:Fe-S cluster assembly iron-binding protein IscA
MFVRLDRHSCSEFLAQWITDVNIDIVNAGCAGSKISLSPRAFSDDRIQSENFQGISFWVVPELVPLLDGAQIAKAKWKYYLVSEKIQSRCGCGTSFSFEKKTIPTNLTKIHRLQNALKMSPEVRKMQAVLKDSRKN